MKWQDVRDQVIPGWTYHPAADQQGYFDSYRAAVNQLNDPGPEENGYSATLLAVSERIYDGEITRRESINTRCGVLLGTGGILGTLVVAAGQLGLAQKKGSFGPATWVVLALFIASLLYIGASITLALLVQGDRQGSIVDPTDLPPADMAANKYSVVMARVHLKYTIWNYQTNNAVKYRLESAQRYLRNGIICIIAAGILSPWALHSGTTTAASPSHSVTRTHVQGRR
jgi:hypothetical protein